MTPDCHLAAVAERRPEARTSHTITAMRTRAPRATHSQISGEVDPLLAVGELVDDATAAGATALWVADGWAAADGLGGETLAVRLGGVILAVRLGGWKLALRLGERLAIGPPPDCPQAVTRNPVKRIAAVSSKLLVKRRIWIPPRVVHEPEQYGELPMG
jgi:hypothetical protein